MTPEHYGLAVGGPGLSPVDREWLKGLEGQLRGTARAMAERRTARLPGTADLRDAQGFGHRADRASRHRQRERGDISPAQALAIPRQTPWGIA